MQIRVLFFGQLKDIAGAAEDLYRPSGPESLQALFESYAARFPALRGFENSLVLARNAQFVPRETLLEDGDEVAFLPPVSGGGGDGWLHVIDDPGGHFFGLTSAPIDTQALARRVQRDEDGAVVCFEGVVRNNTKGRSTLFLDYECYEPMAIRTMAALGAEIAAAHAVGRIGMVHRLGRLEIGEASVAIVVASPHRRAAFDAALEGINRLKKLVPIWKKEHFADGEVWVEGEWDPSVLPR